MITNNARPAPATRLDPRVESLAARIVALAASCGHLDLAQTLDQDLTALASEPPPTVVVAGKRHCGKSTLINTLLGRRPLPTAASAGPTRANARDRDAPSPAPLATELRLVEAPGPDSVQPHQRALAVQQAKRADTILFVLDPEAPLSEPERQYLDQTASAVAEVIFVVAKADLSIDVETVAAADRDLLRALDPRWTHAPLFVVSAHEKALADVDGDKPLALNSGLPGLQEHLRTRLRSHPTVIRSATVVQRCRQLVRRLEDAERATLDSEPNDATAEAAVTRHRDYVERTTDWAGEFTRDYQRRTRQVTERELRLRLLERRERRDTSIKSGKITLEAVTAEVKADLVDVAEQSQAALVEHAAAVVGDWSWRLELDGVHLPALSRAERAEILTPASDIASANWEKREIAHGISGAVNIARSAATGRSLAGLLPGGLAMGTGIGVVLTGLSWATTEWLRTKLQDQQGAIAFAQAAFARAQIELEATLREQALSLQPIAQTALQQRIDERRRALAIEAARLQQDAKARLPQRTAAREAAAQRLAQLEPWSRLLDQLAESFTATLRCDHTPVPALT